MTGVAESWSETIARHAAELFGGHKRVSLEYIKAAAAYARSELEAERKYA